MCMDSSHSGFAAAIGHLLVPFAILCAIVLSIQLAYSIARGPGPDTSLRLSAVMTSAWLFLYPMLIGIYTVYWSSHFPPALTVRTAFITFIVTSFSLGIGSWSVIPLFIGLCALSERAKGHLVAAAPASILFVGFLSSWLVLRAWQYFCQAW
jgi:hypothetical protein